MPGKVGQATSAVVFFRQLGQSIGLVAMGTVVTSTYIPAFHKGLPSALGRALPSQLTQVFENPLVLTESDIMAPIRTGFEHYGAQGQAAFNIVLNAVKVGLVESIRDTILLNLVLILLTLVVVCFLKEIPLRSREEE
jgi:hypothetical protein